MWVMKDGQAAYWIMFLRGIGSSIDVGRLEYLMQLNASHIRFRGLRAVASGRGHSLLGALASVSQPSRPVVGSLATVVVGSVRNPQ